MTNYSIDITTLPHEKFVEICSERIESVLGNKELPLSPWAARRHIKLCLEHKLTSEIFQKNCVVFLFGSIARGEPGNDIDLLVVYLDDAQFHYYNCINSLTKIDLNIASSSWLLSVTQDVEWGFVFSEAIVLYSSSELIEKLWYELVINYWQSSAIKNRISSHISDFYCLQSSATIASSTGNSLFGRYCYHEALRSVGKSIIEKYGTRVFSHKTFVSEVVHSCQRANIPISYVYNYLNGITGQSGKQKSIKNQYICIRKNISLVLRYLSERSLNSFNISKRWEKRCHMIGEAARTNAGFIFEKIFEKYNANQWLPQLEDLQNAMLSANRIIKWITDKDNKKKRSTDEKSSHQEIGKDSRPISQMLLIPKLNPIDGARWIQMRGNRMTIILNTGGCKIGKCRFCSLPSYSLAKSDTNPLETIKRALNKYRPLSVALYNDGSVLNEDELEQSELFRICDEFSNFYLERLWVDSLPRFVNSKLINTIKKRSGVDELIIGMGLQVQGNRFAMRMLRRPDPDCIFERAIELIHDAQASVRIYLLWGYSFLLGKRGGSLLQRSIKWATQRGVEYITVCPYMMPKANLKKDSGYELCDLRSVLAQMNYLNTKINVADWIASPCGIQRTAYGCPNCEEALRLQNWSEGEPCTYGKDRELRGHPQFSILPLE